MTGLLTTTRRLRPRTPAQREAAMARLERATRRATECATELLSTNSPTARDKAGSTPLALACAARAATDLAAAFADALASSKDRRRGCVWDAAKGAAKAGGHRSLALLLDLGAGAGWDISTELSPLLRAACERARCGAPVCSWKRARTPTTRAAGRGRRCISRAAARRRAPVSVTTG